MMKLFRKIRQQLVTENRLTKYLLYAIGEIVLVVLGILIAVQINKWNDNEKNLNKAVDYISDLQRDLRSDTLIFGTEIRKIEYLIEYKKGGLLNKEWNEIESEQLESLYINQYHNIKMNNITFERLKNSDVFSLGKYKDLFIQVNEYYTFYQEYLKNFNSWEVEMFNNDFNF